MRKVLLLLVFVFFGCSKPDCEAEIEALNNQYTIALKNAGTSPSAWVEVTKQYQSKLNKINNSCN